MIRAVENPDSIGFNNGVWYPPSKKGYDPNNLGFGIDKNEYSESVKRILDSRGAIPYLTESEEHYLRN